MHSEKSLAVVTLEIATVMTLTLLPFPSVSKRVPSVATKTRQVEKHCMQKFPSSQQVTIELGTEKLHVKHSSHARSHLPDRCFVFTLGHSSSFISSLQLTKYDEHFVY